MPIHDWSLVSPGIFHDFHHAWIEEIKRVLNKGILPQDYYAMAEQRAGGYGPEVLALELNANGNGSSDFDDGNGGGIGLLRAKPKVQFIAESDKEFYLRKQNRIAVRHVSDDRVVAMVEIVSPGNKSSQSAVRSFVEKTAEMLEHGLHLLILDLQSPSRRDPQGIHGLIWDDVAGENYLAPLDKPLTLAAYEVDRSIRCYVEPIAVGDDLIDMPLFLLPGAHVAVPLERTYSTSWEAFPKRWQRVVQPTI